MEDFSPGGSAEKGSTTRYLTEGLKETHFLMLAGLFAVVSLSRDADEVDRSAGRLEPAELFMAESMALSSLVWAASRMFLRVSKKRKGAGGLLHLLVASADMSSYLRYQDNER